MNKKFPYQAITFCPENASNVTKLLELFTSIMNSNKFSPSLEKILCERGLIKKEGKNIRITENGEIVLSDLLELTGEGEGVDIIVLDDEQNPYFLFSSLSNLYNSREKIVGYTIENISPNLHKIRYNVLQERAPILYKIITTFGNYWGLKLFGHVLDSSTFTFSIEKREGVTINTKNITEKTGIIRSSAGAIVSEYKITVETSRYRFEGECLDCNETVTGILAIKRIVRRKLVSSYIEPFFKTCYYKFLSDAKTS